MRTKQGSLPSFIFGKRIRIIEKRIAKTNKVYTELSKDPKTFSASVAFGNPGGCMSKSLGRRVDKWHEKLSNLAKKEGRLKTHVLILQGKPLTSMQKRDYTYFTNWGSSNLFGKELEARFQRAIQDAPRYVQQAYKRRR